MDPFWGAGHLADAYVEPSMDSDAEMMLRRTLAARRDGLGADHEKTRETLDALAALYVHTGGIDEAARLRAETGDC